MLQTYVLIEKNKQAITSGAGQKVAVKSFKHTSCVNDGEELSIGSVCANAVEITFFDQDGNLDLTAGDVIYVERNDGNAYYEAIGRYIIDQPTRPTPNTMKVTGYDFVTKLDVDLTAWMKGLRVWPYTVQNFAIMVAAKCGLNINVDWDNIPNAAYKIYEFSYAGVTGRMLMRWIAEICARYCYADGDGTLRFGWYTDSGETITASGYRYYFEGGLKFEEYSTKKIAAVQIQLSDGESGALWPEKAAGINSYIIRNNAILMSHITQDTENALNNIANAVKNDTYTPCKVAIRACLDIKAGHKVTIVDRNGRNIRAYVMTKITEGQKDTLECTGSVRRDSTSNVNNKKAPTLGEATNAAQLVAQKAAQAAVDGQTQADIFNKLTNNGELQGLFYQGGKWYINAEFVQVYNLVANAIIAGILKSVDGSSYFDLDQGEFRADDGNGNCVSMAHGDLILDYKGQGQSSVLLTAFAGGGRGIIFQKASGAQAGRFGVANDEIVLSLPSENTNGALSVGVPVWKTITYMDASGQPATMKVLAQG